MPARRSRPFRLTFLPRKAGGTFRPDKPNFHYFAEDPALAMRSLDRVLAVTRGKLHVGHGGPLSHGDLTRWRADSIES